jgi:hypothetical protein
MNNWSLTVEKEGRKPITKHGQLQGDEFAALVTDPTGILARVNMNIGEGEDYGRLKVGASVSLTCDQNEPMIDKAAELACRKSMELMQDGYKLLTGETS